MVSMVARDMPNDDEEPPSTAMTDAVGEPDLHKNDAAPQHRY
jgi:hypothetical protein